MSRRIGIAALSVASLAIGACGGEGTDANGSSELQRVTGKAELNSGTAAEKAKKPAAPARPQKAKKPTIVQVQQSQYGDVLFDGKGFVLYLFTRDGGKKSQCYGDCAVAWPPYIKKGKLKGGDGIDQSALGKTERKDGSQQVTYHGHPLYYYEGDNDPGEILCHNVQEFGGGWFVVQPDGHPAP